MNEDIWKVVHRDLNHENRVIKISEGDVFKADESAFLNTIRSGIYITYNIIIENYVDGFYIFHFDKK